MNYVIVGTAGHVDHGKTTLVKALTGIDTDRLQEEKKRGITIELGFAFFDLPSGLRAGVVDVPGHERFIKNMLAGVSGIDLVVLVIAADEGVMPQTKEHLDILELLGVKKGIIVLSKVDLVEEDWLLLIEEEIKKAVEGTFLADAPVIPVSAITGQGMEQLKKTIDNLAEELPKRETAGYFRLPIDRVFTMTGFGTVVTGTLLSGKLRVGDLVEILPQGISSRIRTLQVHGSKVEEGLAGQRVAVNLANVEVSQLERGGVLVQPGIWKPTRFLDVRLNLLSGASKVLANRERVRFHLGTSEVMGRVVLLDQGELEAGKACFAQIRLENEVVASPGDLFVIRSYSPITTLGGGSILDPYPLQHKRFREEVIEELAVKEKGSLDQLLEQVLLQEKFRFWTKEELAQALQVEEVTEPLKQLETENKVFQLANSYLHFSFLARIQEELENLLKGFHHQFPLKAGYNKELARKKLPGKLSLKTFNTLLDYFQQEGWLTAQGDICRLSSHSPAFSAEQKMLKEKIEEMYLLNPFNPPAKTEVFNAIAKFAKEDKVKQVYEALVDLGLLVMVATDLVFHREALEKGKEILKEKVEDCFTVAQFRDWVGSSRKYALPLLEYYDRIGFTKRNEDKRTIKRAD